MATLADLKARIVAEMARDDLETDIPDVLLYHIQDACEFYSDTKWWFNSILTTVTTTANVATVTIPSTVRIIERLTIPAYDRELREVTLGGLDETTSNAAPSHYSYYNDSIRFWPTPDAAYTLNVYGIAKVAAPAVDADTSIWTNEAAPLIAAHARMTLSRDVFRDPDGTQLAQGAITDWRTRLKRETARRLRTPLRSTMWAGEPFSITTG